MIYSAGNVMNLTLHIIKYKKKEDVKNDLNTYIVSHDCSLQFMSPCIFSRWCLIRTSLPVAPCHFTRRIITIIDFRSKMHRLRRFEERFL